MKKLLIILMITLLLTGCTKPGTEPVQSGEPAGTYDVTQETVPTEDLVTQDTSVTEETTVSEEQESVTTSATEETEESTTEEEVVVMAPVFEVLDFDCRAADIINKLNSAKVHAKFTVGESYDGESILGNTIEYFIDGANMVFIDDYSINIIDGITITMLFSEDMTYVVEDYDPDNFGRAFGYEPSAYSFSYEEEADDCVTEVLNVEQYGNFIISTWKFYDDGRIIVRDENKDSGAFTLYSFEFITEDISDMDMSIPDGYTKY